jgi:hypothetical protein
MHQGCEPFLVDLLGLSHGEMVGRTVGELSLFRDIESNRAVLERLQQDGYVRYDDVSLKAGDNRHIAVEMVGRYPELRFPSNLLTYLGYRAGSKPCCWSRTIPHCVKWLRHCCDDSVTWSSLRPMALKL